METYFAPAERATQEELTRDIDRIGSNPVIQGLMSMVGGLLAVLNSGRQVLAVNDSLLASLRITDPHTTLGLRPGEILHCNHANEEPHGCGTTRHCASCGAAIAMVSCLSSNQPVERKCVIRTSTPGSQTDICFRVRACPMTIDQQRYLLLFLQDITLQEKRAALERAFFHDVNNLLSGLLGASELLLLKYPEDNHLLNLMKQQASRLINEVTIQRSLLHAELSELRPTICPVPVADILDELQGIFSSHSAAAGKTLQIDGLETDIMVRTDSSLVIRTLSNMLTNAFEASTADDTVRLWLEQDQGRLCFAVWNRQEIDETVRLRIFQRYISTKQGVGRGTGTYSMKLFAETFLNGTVDFTSSPIEGTVFRLCLPT